MPATKNPAAFRLTTYSATLRAIKSLAREIGRAHGLRSVSDARSAKHAVFAVVKPGTAAAVAAALNTAGLRAEADESDVVAIRWPHT